MPYLYKIVAEEQEMWTSVSEGLGFDFPSGPFTVPRRFPELIDVVAILCEFHQNLHGAREQGRNVHHRRSSILRIGLCGLFQESSQSRILT